MQRRIPSLSIPGKCRICPYPPCIAVTDPIASWRQRGAHPIGAPGAEPLTCVHPPRAVSQEFRERQPE